MSKDTCIKANTYCPVHKGIVGADCWHDAKDFGVPRSDWKLVDELHRLRAENAALVKQNQKMQAALKLALPCVERARDVEDCSYGRNFSEHRRDLAHKRFDAVKESIELPDLAAPVINRIKAEGMMEAASIQPVIPSNKGQSPILFEDGYADGWAECLHEYQKAISAKAERLHSELEDIRQEKLASVDPLPGKEWSARAVCASAMADITDKTPIMILILDENQRTKHYSANLNNSIASWMLLYKINEILNP